MKIENSFSVHPVRVNELAELLEITPPVVSRRLSSLDRFTIKSSGRTVGITPEGAEDYFRSAGHDHLFNTTVAVVSSVCGGTQKTSSVLCLASAARRITSRSKAVVVIDLDSQASATETLLGAPVPDTEPVLVNFLEGTATLDDITHRVDTPDAWMPPRPFATPGRSRLEEVCGNFFFEPLTSSCHNMAQIMP